MKLLLDTNVISELRKDRSASAGVRHWWSRVRAQDLFISVIVLGEIRKGVERLRSRDTRRAEVLDQWLAGLSLSFDGRIVDVDARIADCWGRLLAADPVPATDALLAASALVYDMVLVTRNVRDLQRTGVRLYNPFDD